MNQETIKAFVSAGHGNLEQVKTMLSANPDLLDAAFEWREGDFETALQAASHVGQSAIALYLLEHGAKLEITTAAMLGDLASVKDFIAADSNAIRTRGAHGISLLVHAVISGHEELIRHLVTLGATEGASMAFNIAVDFADYAIVQFLLEQTKPDLQWKNMKGKTALDLARENNQADILSLLEGR